MRLQWAECQRGAYEPSSRSIIIVIRILSPPEKEQPSQRNALSELDSTVLLDLLLDTFKLSERELYRGRVSTTVLAQTSTANLSKTCIV
jgi:hypothetical protein